MQLNPTQLLECLKDSRFSDIGALPSQGNGAYSWDTLHGRPFDINEFRLISKASTLSEMSHMIRAMDLVLTQDAGNLTIGDFYYVMMWLRIHSLPKSPMIVDWYCETDVLRNKETGALVFNDESFVQPENIHDYEAVPCDTQNTEQVHMSTVDIISLDDEQERRAKLKEGEELKPLLPDWADWPRARHIDAIAKALSDPELSMLAPAAQWFKGNTFADRLEAMFDNTDGKATERWVEAQALNDALAHGIREHTQLTCRNCRNKMPYVVQVTPLNFFP